MFKFNELRFAQVELTNRCQASCPLCARNVHGGLDNPTMKLNDWSLDDFKSVFTPDVMARMEGFDLAGTAGEPTLNKNLLEICKYIGETNNKTFISIFTNGGARNTEWWTTLGKELPPNHCVVFAIDGLEDTNHIYRVGVTYDLVIKNATAFIKAGGNATWQFIKFKHNEHQIDEAMARAKALGFNNFDLKVSRRHGNEPFKVLDRKGNITHYLEASTTSEIKFIRRGDFDDYKNWKDADKISCYVKENREIYIDANYVMLPCCILGSLAFLNIDYNREYYKKHNVYDSVSNYDAGYGLNESFNQLIEELGGYNALDVRYHSIYSILSSNTWQQIWEQKWKDRTSACCIKMCSASSPFSSIEDQEISSVKL